ncbi:hypothetical protein RAE07_11545 [Corynebacterium kefirresidentii]|uniref:hypothetical protein n=1 Tax=Corynebacterium sp. CTNIH14 TaxID=3230065 RepID=UPI0029344B2A|nr:hypothetical protein [Corynebacterium kefirresidentii]MDV2415939.1 hypothetical protein [Corynebacterium kefirresidentii]
MSDFESARWRHPSSKARIDAEIEMMEAGYGQEAQDVDYSPAPAKRTRRAGMRKPRGYGMVWRF